VIDIRVIKRLGSFTVNAAFRSDEAGVTALFGRSGAGKTTLIGMVAGLIQPDDGHVVINGACLGDSENRSDLPPEKRRIGYVFQDGRLFPHLSVRGNLTYGMNRVPPSRRYVSFDAVVSLLGIEHLLARRPAMLSGGEKQRVAMGRALLTSPALLLMDEPLASLDADRKAEVLPFIARLSRAFSIPTLYVSHCMAGWPDHGGVCHWQRSWHDGWSVGIAASRQAHRRWQVGGTGGGSRVVGGLGLGTLDGNYASNRLVLPAAGLMLISTTLANATPKANS